MPLISTYIHLQEQTKMSPRTDFPDSVFKTPTYTGVSRDFYNGVTTQSYLFMHDIPGPDTILNIKIHSCADDIASPAELLKYKTTTNILQR